MPRDYTFFMISKKDIEHLAELARIKLPAKDEEKLSVDLEKILGHFAELNELDTSAVEPMAGGTHLKSVMREDMAERTRDTGKGKEQFPEQQGGFLKVPKVFG